MRLSAYIKLLERLLAQRGDLMVYGGGECSMDDPTPVLRIADEDEVSLQSPIKAGQAWWLV